jgi:hypothetical protein
MRGFPEPLLAPTSRMHTSLNMGGFGEAKRSRRQSGVSCPHDERQAGPGGLPTGGGRGSGPVPAGGWEGFLFFILFQKKREKNPPPRGTRLGPPGDKHGGKKAQNLPHPDTPDSTWTRLTPHCPRTTSPALTGDKAALRASRGVGTLR